MFEKILRRVNQLLIKVFCLCHICCVCSVSVIFSNHCIKLFWCLTVVVGLIKLYYIKIFVFLNYCLTEHWSIYLLICAYCAWLHCLVLKYSWLIIYYMILSLFVSYGLLLGWALFWFCSVFVLCCFFYNSVMKSKQMFYLHLLVSGDWSL